MYPVRTAAPAKQTTGCEGYRISRTRSSQSQTSTAVVRDAARGDREERRVRKTPNYSHWDSFSNSLLFSFTLVFSCFGLARHASRAARVACGNRHFSKNRCNDEVLRCCYSCHRVRFWRYRQCRRAGGQPVRGTDVSYAKFCKLCKLQQTQHMMMRAAAKICKSAVPNVTFVTVTNWIPCHKPRSPAFLPFQSHLTCCVANVTTPIR